MTSMILISGDDSARLNSLAGLLGHGSEVVAWAPRQPVPAAARAAVDFHVTDAVSRAAALETLDAQLPPDVPILACCHTDSVTRLAVGARHPDRFTGFGLLPPFEGRTSVECARGLRTSDAAAGAAEAIWRGAGLEPIWVGDAAGLVMPRIVACLANEAAFTVMERTALPEDVDRAMELGTAYPRGPLTWAMLLGLDHVVAILDGLAREQGDDRYRVAPLLRKMALAGHADWSIA